MSAQKTKQKNSASYLQFYSLVMHSTKNNDNIIVRVMWTNDFQSFRKCTYPKHKRSA